MRIAAMATVLLIFACVAAVGRADEEFRHGGSPAEADPVPPGEMPPPMAPTPPSEMERPRTRTDGGPMDGTVPVPHYGTLPPLPPVEPTREMLLPPTDPALRSPDSPLAPPTENAAGTLPAFGTPGPGRAAMPFRPAPAWGRSRGGAFGGPAAQDRQRLEVQNQLVVQQQLERLQPTAGIGPAAARLNKPYANYNPGPAVSPYMNLFRYNNNNALDNYTTFVRPQLQQIQTNQAFGGEIRGLQSTQQLQNNALRKLGKIGPGGHPTPTNAPEYFQNYGAFFPAFAR